MLMEAMLLFIVAAAASIRRRAVIEHQIENRAKMIRQYQKKELHCRFLSLQHQLSFLLLPMDHGYGDNFDLVASQKRRVSSQRKRRKGWRGKQRAATHQLKELGFSMFLIKLVHGLSLSKPISFKSQQIVHSFFFFLCWEGGQHSAN